VRTIATVKRCVIAACLPIALLAAAPAGAHDGFHGKLEIRHTDDFAHSQSSTRYTLLQGSKRTAVKPAESPRFPSGSRVVVRGKKRGRVIRGDVKARPGVRAARTPLGTWRVAVLMVNFSDSRAETWTRTAVAQRFFTDANSTNVFFKEQSWNQVDLAGDVYGWYQLDASSVGCGVDAWATEARAKATAAGVNLGSYDTVAYVFPRVAECGWAGLAELPGSQMWLNGDISVRVASHELGHNMGVHHASALACPGVAVDPADGACTTHEYGDPFSSMGSATRRMAGWHLQQLGYLQASNVQSVTAAGSYTLRSTLAQSADPQLLKIPRASTAARPEYYYIDLRAGGGVFDNYAATDPAVRGVTIRIGNDRTVLRQSRLIDTTPDSNSNALNDFRDAPLAVGRTFSDGDVSITTTALAGGVAVVYVTWSAAAPDLEAPSAPTGVTGTDDGAGIDVSWAPSTDDVGVEGYRVKRDDVTIATVTGTAYRDTTATEPRVYTYCIEAFDAAGNAATSQSCATPARYSPPVVEEPAPQPLPPLPPAAPLPPADTIAPTVTIRSPGRGAKLRRRAVVRANATDDRSVVRIDLFVDGRRVASRRGGKLNVAWQLRRVKRGRHTVTVVARDASGNTGTRSVAVRVSR
jgi:hypothetical protein